jgi:NAD(P)-dependent dehydrogenase (short-subunit alcohol dehydrogenase family)
MKSVVITGSTRGIGFGLADSFLALGCNVTVSGRTPAAVEQAVAALSSRHGSDHLLGQPCNVTDYGQVQALWDAAQARFGRIDIWVNNAGIAHAQMDLWEHSPEQIRGVIETNLVGALYGAKVAIRGMVEQGYGALYNLEGLGSDGRQVGGLALYGSTKRSLSYLTDALIEETRGTPVLVGALRPGMVLTDMLTQQNVSRPEDWARARRIFNILADRVETIVPWAAARMLANQRTGVRFQWLSRGKVLARFITAPLRQRDLFAAGQGEP